MVQVLTRIRGWLLSQQQGLPAVEENGLLFASSLLHPQELCTLKGSLIIST